MPSKIAFAVNIYPSVAKHGQHAVAITNNNDESLVIGFTGDPERAKVAISRIVKSEAGWSHDTAVDYHTLQVEAQSL